LSPFAETVTDPRELEPKHILLINIRQLSFAMLTFSFADPDPGSCAFSSVADPGCLSRIRLFSIPDPNFSSRIPDPHQRCEYFDPKNGFEEL
jgi:hypothetical protein